MRKGISFVVLLFFLFSCKQKPTKHKANPDAVKLNNKAISLSVYIGNTDSAKKAITLLDSATSIDSSYIMGYYNKLIFLSRLKEYDKAISTIHTLLKFYPNAHDLYSTGGMLYEKTGDTISARSYFQKSLYVCNIILDTMSNKSRDYGMISMNRAIDLIMLQEQEKGNKLLKQLYEHQSDSLQKELTLSFMNKSKSEIVEMVFNGVEGEARDSTEAK